MTKHKDALRESLSRLKLKYLAVHLDDVIASATKKQLSPMQLMELVVQLELEEAKRQLVETRLRGSKLGRFQPMADFDWSWPKNIARQTIDQLFTLSFVEEPANVILIGSAGLGKTMIAKNLGHQAALRGHSVRFIDTADLLTDLSAAESPIAFKRRLSRYTSPDLLILDEVGYLSHSAKSADILFQVVSKRHERKATMITSNKAFKDWGSVFPGSGCVVALIDRLTQCSEIILVEGESYRLKQAEDRKRQKDRPADTVKVASK